MKRVEFVVPGPLFPYRRVRDSNSRGRGYENYERFKRKVLLLAMEQGYRRIVGSAGTFVELSVVTFFRRGARADWSNVYKAIEDALFEQDRWVKPGNWSGHNWSCGQPESARVTIRWEE